MMGRLQVICTMDQIKEAKRNVQKYMRKHKSDEDFIDNISDDFVMGFMISQRMVWDDYDNGTQRENDNFGKWIPCSERLPENAMNVIAQFSSGTVTELRYAGNGIFEGIYEYSTKVIIAWMPLPELYKQNDEGAEK